MAAVKEKRSRTTGKVAKAKAGKAKAEAARGPAGKDLDAGEQKSAAAQRLPTAEKRGHSEETKASKTNAGEKPTDSEPKLTVGSSAQAAQDAQAVDDHTSPRSTVWSRGIQWSRELLADHADDWPARPLSKLKKLIAYLTPTGLYKRTLIIIVAPIVLLEGVVAFVFMERHWQAVTRRLSEATARDVSAVIEVYNSYPNGKNYTKLKDLAFEKMSLQLTVLPSGDLPPACSKAVFCPA